LARRIRRCCIVRSIRNKTAALLNEPASRAVCARPAREALEAVETLDVETAREVVRQAGAQAGAKGKGLYLPFAPGAAGRGARAGCSVAHRGAGQGGGPGAIAKRKVERKDNADPGTGQKKIGMFHTRLADFEYLDLSPYRQIEPTKRAQLDHRTTEKNLGAPQGVIYGHFRNGRLLGIAGAILSTFDTDHFGKTMGRIGRSTCRRKLPNTTASNWCWPA
jgi:hypothetical protein